MNLFGWQYVLQKFHEKQNVLSTFDFISDIHTAAEYRRILCDLRKKGYKVECFRAAPRHFVYRLTESQPSLGGIAA